MASVEVPTDRPGPVGAVSEPAAQGPGDQAASDRNEAGAELPTGAARSALLWVPGCHATPNSRVEAIARRLKAALDHKAATAGVTFRVAEKVEEVDRGVGGKFRRATLFREGPAGEQPVLDLYEYDYRATLLRPHLEASAFGRWLQVTWIALVSLGRVGWTSLWNWRVKTLLEKLQLLAGAASLLLLVAYAWLLLAALVAAFEQLSGWHVVSNGIKAAYAWLVGVEEPQRLPNLGWLGDLAAALLVVGLGFGGGVPALGDRVKELGATMLATLAYLRIGVQRAALAGRLRGLIEYVAEQNPGYRRVDLVGYSFGSLVVLDSLFPQQGPPDPRYRLVRGLVTIGCPWDGVRLLYPGFTRNRFASAGVPAGWLNIYAPLDVFGSNFRDDAELADATVAVAQTPDGDRMTPTNVAYRTVPDASGLSVMDVITFMGIRAHTYYWGDREEGETTCFEIVVGELFSDDPILA
jgi:hypothetical protein